MKIFFMLGLAALPSLVTAGGGRAAQAGGAARQDFAARSIFRTVSAKQGVVERFGCFELNVGLDSLFTNPYDYTEVALRCVFAGPRGRVDTVDGFYMTDRRIDTVTGGVSGGGAGHFAVRYSPVVAGRWTYRLFCETRSGRQSGPGGHFTCVAGEDRGFIRSAGSPYLSFAGGAAFIPIGENMGWAQKNAYLDYRRWISRLSASGGNFIRVWMPAWGLGLEWTKGWGGYQGIGRYQQSNAALLDWLLDYCTREHVYVMLSLDHHGQVSSRVDPNWKDNPYNAVNGGPCEHTWDFFTDARARALIRNRFRYIVARYGYSSHILCWELFNEVDWTDDFVHHRADVANWHAEMAAWLRRLDVNHHLITTSYGDARWDSLTWRLPGIDFTQTHYYTSKPLDSVLSAATARYRAAYGKPTLTGEFGLSTTGRGLAEAGPGGMYVHNALWATLLSGAMGSGLPWYWDNYIDGRDLYGCFSGVAKFAGRIDFIGHGYAPAAVDVDGGAGAVRGYGLKARDSTRLAAWILNARYKAAGGDLAGGGKQVADGAAAAVGGAVIEARGMRDGKYEVCWWDCRRGVIDSTSAVVVRDGVLRVTAPEIIWDKALTAVRISGSLSGTSKGSGHTAE
ncbi:MAG TPA: DUF5060 domain-containing protein [Puia sp.]|nr:DUF5060 domain-containing protein [Puia sp.]